MSVMSFIDLLKFNADGLIPAIVQDAQNGQVLMMAWMNKESAENSQRRSHGLLEPFPPKILGQG